MAKVKQALPTSRYIQSNVESMKYVTHQLAPPHTQPAASGSIQAQDDQAMQQPIKPRLTTFEGDFDKLL